MNGMVPVQFQVIFAEHYPAVLRKMIQLVRDRTIAEDLAQEVFLKLYRVPPDDLNCVGAWLHRVSMTVAYDYLRKVSRQHRLLEKKGQDDQMQLHTVSSNEEAVIQEWELDVVKRVLQKLSARDREALMLKESGYSYAEIAEKLHVNQKNVGSLIARANLRFRKKYLMEESVEE